LLIVALAAVDVSKNFVEPPIRPLLLIIVASPAVDRLWNSVDPAKRAALGRFGSPALFLIVSVFPALFTMPAPWIVRTLPLVVSIVKTFAPMPKLMPEAMMLLLSVTLPPFIPMKCATLLSFVHAVFAIEVAVSDHTTASGSVLQMPLPAGSLFPISQFPCFHRTQPPLRRV
jgi:hypothetical protein